MSKPSSASYLPRKEWEILCTPRIQHYLGDSLSYMKKAVRINVDLKVLSLIANCLSELSIIMCVLHTTCTWEIIEKTTLISAAPFTLFSWESAGTDQTERRAFGECTFWRAVLCCSFIPKSATRDNARTTAFSSCSTKPPQETRENFSPSVQKQTW